jgi:hypothetical protein
LKLPLLLAEFLYERKKLSLPGIGIFTLINSKAFRDDSEKKQNEFIPEVEFENAEVNSPDDDLIEYIKKNTGKIKPLALADLDSYITLGKQMINIGNPFYIDGVGTLTKNKEGKYAFVAGQHEATGSEKPKTNKEERTAKKQSMFDEDHEYYKAQKNTGKKIMLALAVAGGLAIVAWGGYKLYEKNTSSEKNEALVSVPVNDSAITDTQRASGPAVDSSKIKNKEIKQQELSATKVDSFQYKFIILQTDNKYKALKRYNQLLSYLLKIKMQTRDSLYFKLYFAFPAVAKDTLHIKDSLNLVYATHTTIEPAMNN